MLVFRGALWNHAKMSRATPTRNDASPCLKWWWFDPASWPGTKEASDFAGTFGHGLGHGLGLDVHEAPRLSTESSDTLAVGNVVTVEPGVYLEGRFGIRIEDDVIVTEDGIENPVRVTKELLAVS